MLLQCTYLAFLCEEDHHLENGAFGAAFAVGDCADETNDLQFIRLRRGLRPRLIGEGRRELQPRVIEDSRPESEGVGYDDVSTFRIHVDDLKVGRVDDLVAAHHATNAEVPREGGGDLLAQSGERDVSFGQESFRLAVEIDQGMDRPIAKFSL